MTIPKMPAQVVAFRNQYRSETISPHYRGRLHFAFTSSVALSVIIWSVSRVHDPSWLELLTPLLTFLFANAAEYFGHRGPMHHKGRRLRILHKRHTLEHHRFYTHDAMIAESPRDFHMVLFPPVMLLFFLGGLGTPIGALLFFVASPNAGWMFVATAVSYFLTYEWLHTAYHLPPDSIIGRLPGMALLRRLHTAHHDPRLMSRYNFNITFPIFDLLMGTYHPGAPVPQSQLQPLVDHTR
jgi:hypothetical protein